MDRLPIAGFPHVVDRDPGDQVVHADGVTDVGMPALKS
jgi:hypothetical protein